MAINGTNERYFSERPLRIRSSLLTFSARGKMQHKIYTEIYFGYLISAAVLCFQYEYGADNFFPTFRFKVRL